MGVGKRARVPGMHKYFIGGGDLCMSVGENGREISMSLNMGVILKGWGT
jgi:hypothetical protein